MPAAGAEHSARWPRCIRGADLVNSGARRTDQATARRSSLLRHATRSARLQECALLRAGTTGQAVPLCRRAGRGAGLDPGSSLFGAGLAAALACRMRSPRISPRRRWTGAGALPGDSRVRPLERAYAMLAQVVGADARAEAKRLFTTQQQSFVPAPRPSGAGAAPIDDIGRSGPGREVDGGRVRWPAALSATHRPARGHRRFVERHRPEN